MKIKLNLIPQAKKDEIKQNDRFKLILKWEAEALGLFVVFVLLLVSINYILKLNFFLVSNNVGVSASDSAQIKEINKYDKEMREVNLRISEIERISGGQLQWMNFFNHLDGIVSGNVTLNSLLTKNYAVSLAGNAKTRDNLIEFKDNLGSNDCFSNVDLPLSNLVNKENIDFQIDFKIKPGCLK